MPDPKPTTPRNKRGTLGDQDNLVSSLASAVKKAKTEDEKSSYTPPSSDATKRSLRKRKKPQQVTDDGSIVESASEKIKIPKSTQLTNPYRAMLNSMKVSTQSGNEASALRGADIQVATISKPSKSREAIQWSEVVTPVRQTSVSRTASNKQKKVDTNRPNTIFGTYYG
jgi:hypothetical protein